MSKFKISVLAGDDEALPDGVKNRVRDLSGSIMFCSCGFISSGWDTKKLATERGAQHLDEHETATPMPELAEFLGGEK